MKTIGNKILLLLVGLLLGIIIGGVGVSYYLESGGKNTYIYNNTFKAEQSSQKNTEKKKNKTSSKQLQKTLSTDSVSTFSNSKISANEEGGLISPDTISNAETQLAEENIIVKKDELLAVKNVQVIEIESTERITKKDSVLQNISGIKEPVATGWYIIEYWKSPINYKGYKTNKNKIVLFGIAEAEKPKLFKIGDDFYLRNNERVFRLRKSAEFIALESITDPSIISKLI